MSDRSTVLPSPEVASIPPIKSVRSTSQASAVASIGSLLEKYQLEDKGGYISQEFQDYGYRLALALDDMKHKSLYIKMAKREPRGLLERALSYVSDAKEVQSKARLFMWKMQQLKKEQKQTKATLTEAQSAQLKSGATATLASVKRTTSDVEAENVGEQNELFNT